MAYTWPYHSTTSTRVFLDTAHSSTTIKLACRNMPYSPFHVSSRLPLVLFTHSNLLQHTRPIIMEMGSEYCLND
ncbi:predicted protein [Lichtheimia corymbifera JMRC:FSU:9682]|uniref:Uncharacterized protein n=1 Tax=Lichtheimia corymbifera JMRC:FSU:9682 TaxID=1263082 RepID=A0A068RZF0_9FUNG|nr:predicted protein [Lichtheimia corymbifera JMRC:FSU:9682]